MNALDQLKVEGAVDIFQIVRRIKITMPDFVETEVSYLLVKSFNSNVLSQHPYCKHSKKQLHAL